MWFEKDIERLVDDFEQEEMILRRRFAVVPWQAPLNDICCTGNMSWRVESIYWTKCHKYYLRSVILPSMCVCLVLHSTVRMKKLSRCRTNGWFTCTFKYFIVEQRFDREVFRFKCFWFHPQTKTLHGQFSHKNEGAWWLNDLRSLTSLSFICSHKLSLSCSWNE